jgi:hypothetical protein
LGGNLFKVLGARFGEFVDYDEATACRSSLDVARLKISTPVRHRIETPIRILVMGVVFEVWMIEEEEDRSFVGSGDREFRGDRSWEGSSASPCKALVVDDDDLSVHGEEESEDASVDLAQGQIVSLPKDLDSDNFDLLDEREQIDTRLSNQDLVLEKDRMSDVGQEGLSNGVVIEEGGPEDVMCQLKREHAWR